MRPHLILFALALATTAAVADDKATAVPIGGEAPLTLTIPQGAEVTTKGRETTIHGKGFWIYLWRTPGAKSIAEVVPHVGDVIKGQFLKYVVESSESIKVAGREARHLMGKGEEADDNDPGTADVVVFTDGQNVFTACVHGERDEAAKERPVLLKVLESVKAP
jgi:hypothetical protein